MYEVLVNDQTIYYPSNPDYTIFETDFQRDVGMSGEFTFSVPPENPNYSLPGKGAIVTILRDGKEYWRGEVNEVSTDINKNRVVYCLEDLSWLADEYLTPTLITNETYSQRFQAAIAAYNSGRPADRQFVAGYITNVTSSNTCYWATEYEWSILDSLRERICRDNGYIKVRRVTSGGVVTRYIDIVKLSDYGNASSQYIEFGINLLEYLQEMKMNNFTNALTPYGAELDSEVYEDYNARLAGTPIQDAASIATYGRHSKTVIFDTDDLTTLNNLAAAYLSRYSQPQITMKISALDLAEMSNQSYFEIGDSIRIIAEPFAIDQFLYLTSQTMDLQDPSKNEVELSGYVTKGASLSAQMIDAADLIKDMPSKSAILDAAKKNALNLLLDETKNGYVVFEYDANNQSMIAINILNQPTIAASTKRWRWSATGFGYMKRSSAGTETSPAWDDLPIAITMNGEIVADAVTTGTMYANRIKGGTLTLGGADNVNGELVIKDAAGTVIGRWNKDGISATKGTFSGDLSAAGGTFAGNLSAAGGTFAGNLSAAGGTFEGQLVAATGTITDGTSVLSLENGSLYMRGPDPALFANKANSQDYACWGASQSAARANGNYLPCPTYDIIQAGVNASDKRLKKHIKDLDVDFAMDLIMGIKPKSYRFKAKKGPKEFQFGVIAQDILDIKKKHNIPDDNRICYEQDDGMLAVDYKQLIAPMISVIQSLQYQINELKGEKNG